MPKAISMKIRVIDWFHNAPDDEVFDAFESAKLTVHRRKTNSIAAPDERRKGERKGERKAKVQAPVRNPETETV